MYYFFFIIIGLHFLFLVTQYILTSRNLFLVENIFDDLTQNRKKISVIIPVRNEVDRIGKCLESLLANDKSAIEEVLIIDNGSNDGTGSLVKKYQIKCKDMIRYFYIKDSDFNLPDNRKAVSLDYAVQKAKGNWLLFIDADIWLANDAIKTIVTSKILSKNLAISFVPKHFTSTWWEKCWLNPYLLFNSSSYKLKKMQDHNTSHAILVGACWLINKSTYLSVGGFQSVYSSVVEDYAFAELLKRNGKKIKLVDGTKLFFLKNYSSFKQLYSTTKKGLATMEINYIVKIALIIFFLILSFLPLILMIPFFSIYLVVYMVIYYLITPLVFLPIRKWSEQSWYTYFYYPLGYLLLFIISCDAFFGSKKVTWRGVDYRV
ncbi:MAG: glycosyltransferase family 2 protein [Patescibacteria group bacterium]|nr:glycosyltransferase family 2 protein [Patescibacteria group bacterium]